MTTKTSKRRTSKVHLAINTALAWGAIFYAIYSQQGATVVASLVGVIALSYGSYVGVGHLDYRAHIRGLMAQVSSERPPDG